MAVSLTHYTAVDSSEILTSVSYLVFFQKPACKSFCWEKLSEWDGLALYYAVTKLSLWTSTPRAGEEARAGDRAYGRPVLWWAGHLRSRARGSSRLGEVA